MKNNQLSKAVSQLSWRLAPTFFEGRGAKPLLEIYRAQSKENTYLNRFVYDELTQTAKGSSTLMSARLDSILQPLGLGIATLSELYSPEVRAKLQGKFYSDPAALVLRGAENKGNSRNTSFIKQLTELVEEANGNLVFPLLITGFDVSPTKDAGYNLQIVKGKDFKAISSDRFKGENHGKKFSQVDELGPIFSKDGKFTLYANDKATLSRLVVDSYGDLYSDDDGVGYSDGDGRVVVVPREASAQILEASFEELQRIRNEDIQKVNSAFVEAEKTYRDALAKK